jgi:hypothetical protein
LNWAQAASLRQRGGGIVKIKFKKYGNINI